MYEELITYLQPIILINPRTELDEEFQICRQGQNPFYLMWRSTGSSTLSIQSDEYGTATDALTHLVRSFLERNSIDGPIKIITRGGKVFIALDELINTVNELDIDAKFYTY